MAKYTEDEKKRALKAFYRLHAASGKTADYIAAQLGVSLNTLSRWEGEQRAKQEKFEEPDTPKIAGGYTEEEKKRALEEFHELRVNQKRSGDYAAGQVGVSLATLWRWDAEMRAKDAPTEIKTYVWEGTITPGEGTTHTHTLTETEFEEDEEDEEDEEYEEDAGPCLALSNGIRVYGPLDELLAVAMAL